MIMVYVLKLALGLSRALLSLLLVSEVQPDEQPVLTAWFIREVDGFDGLIPQIWVTPHAGKGLPQTATW